MNQTTVNNFKNFIYRNINSPVYQPQFEELNKWIRRALVWNATDRVDFQVTEKYLVGIRLKMAPNGANIGAALMNQSGN